MPAAPRGLPDGCRRSRHGGAGSASRRSPPWTSGQPRAVPGRASVGTPGRGGARPEHSPGPGSSPRPPPAMPPSASLCPPMEVLPQPLQLRPQLGLSGLGAQHAESQPRVLLVGRVPLAPPARPAASPNPAPLPARRPRAAAAAARRPRPVRAPSWPGETGQPPAPPLRGNGAALSGPPRRAAYGRPNPADLPPHGAPVGRSTARYRRAPPCLLCGRGGGPGPARIPAAVLIPRPNGPPRPSPARLALGTSGCHGTCPSVLRGSALGHTRRGEGRVLPGAVRLRSRELRLLQQLGLAPGCCWQWPCTVPRLLHACGAGSTESDQRFMLKNVFMELFTIPMLPVGELTYSRRTRAPLPAGLGP